MTKLSGLASPVHTRREEKNIPEKFFISIRLTNYGWFIVYAKFLPTIALEAKYSPDFLPSVSLMSMVSGVELGRISLYRLPTAN